MSEIKDKEELLRLKPIKQSWILTQSSGLVSLLRHVGPRAHQGFRFKDVTFFQKPSINQDMTLTRSTGLETLIWFYY
jgi:hypothetical protein